MQPTQALPVETWAQALSQARIEQGLDLGTLARELMLSLAQIRGIEAGQTNAFHAQNYYLRGVQRYAERLQITLDPDPGTFQASDAASLRNRAPQRAQGIAQRQSSPANALQLPTGRAHGARLGRWLVILVILLVGAGVYMAVDEGWPAKPIEDMLASQSADSSASNPSSAESGTPRQSASEPTQTATTQTGSTRVSQPPPAGASTGTSVVTVDLGSAGNDATLASGSAPSVNSQPAPLANPDTASASDASAQPASASPTTPGSTQAGSDASMQSSATSTGTGPLSDQPAAGTDQSTQAISAAGTQTAMTTSGAPDQPSPQNSAIADEIVLRFNDDCWVELRRTDGASEQGIFKSGDEIRVPASEVDRLVLGNAMAVQATRGGKPFDMNQFTRGGSVARISGQALSQTAP